MNTGPSPTGGPDDIVFILIVILTAIPAALVGLGTAFAFAKIIAKRQEGDGAVAAGADGFLGAMTGLPIGIATGVVVWCMFMCAGAGIVTIVSAQ